MADTYSLPDLPYDYAALEPHISARIMELHHDKHHATYVKAANETLDRFADLQAHDGDVTTLRALEKSLAFNVSGHLLHSALWTSMRPGGASEPDGELRAAINDGFGSFDTLCKQLTDAVSSLQGSGWGALVWEPLAGRLLVEQIYDHQSNMTPGNMPLLVIDGWEHAYYLQYENDKGKYLQGFWNVADWDHAAQRFRAARDVPQLTGIG
jgi:Fe-Mn family superoxide dismutase